MSLRRVSGDAARFPCPSPAASARVEGAPSIPRKAGGGREGGRGPRLLWTLRRPQGSSGPAGDTPVVCAQGGKTPPSTAFCGDRLWLYTLLCFLSKKCVPSSRADVRKNPGEEGEDGGVCVAGLRSREAAGNGPQWPGPRRAARPGDPPRLRAPAPLEPLPGPGGVGTAPLGSILIAQPGFPSPPRPAQRFPRREPGRPSGQGPLSSPHSGPAAGQEGGRSPGPPVGRTQPGAGPGGAGGGAGGGPAASEMCKHRRPARRYLRRRDRVSPDFPAWAHTGLSAPSSSGTSEKRSGKVRERGFRRQRC